MKVFIAGPRKITKLNDMVIGRIDNIINKGYTIVVGDANGVDKAVQLYCNENKYRNVIVYATNGRARNNVGEWEIKNVKVSSNLKGFDFYSAKDIEMARDCDFGFMIWNGKSRGTLNNMLNLSMLNKKIVLYLNTSKQFYNFAKFENVKLLAESCGEEVKEIFNELYKKNYVKQMDLSAMMVSEPINSESYKIEDKD